MACVDVLTYPQTKELASRYERALQESEGVTDKCKSRLEISSEELERLLLQKEGESVKDNLVQQRAVGVGGKRAIGKAVAKGGLLLKGKNPGNVGASGALITSILMVTHRYKDKRAISELEYQLHLTSTGRLLQTRRLCVKNILISSCLEYSE